VADFTTDHLKALGFEGWVPLVTFRDYVGCPDVGGVYVVSYPQSDGPEFSAVSCGGWFQGRNPSVSADVLAANWVSETDVVYIGKASNLRRRLRQFSDFGAGKSIGHYGGRLIWHLPDIHNLSAAWLETPSENPLAVEAKMLSQFRSAFGRAPFANDPQRMGA
jgi:hypothetical protein